MPKPPAGIDLLVALESMPDELRTPHYIGEAIINGLNAALGGTYPAQAHMPHDVNILAETVNSLTVDLMTQYGFKPPVPFP